MIYYLLDWIGDNLKKKSFNRSRRRLLVFGTLSVIMIGYFFYVVIAYSYKLISLKNEEQELISKIASLEEEEEKLKTEIDMLQDPEYIARYARENYLYTRNGEYVIKTDEKDTKQKKETPKDEQYIIYICIGAVLFIILFIIIKHKRKRKSSK